MKAVGFDRTNDKRYDMAIREIIIFGQARRVFVVALNIPLNNAPEAFQPVNQRAEGVIKVVLKP